jgi:hypothetical protein
MLLGYDDVISYNEIKIVHGDDALKGRRQCPRWGRHQNGDERCIIISMTLFILGIEAKEGMAAYILKIAVF